MKNEMIISQIGMIRDKANSFLQKELAASGMKGIAPTHGDILGALYIHGELPMNRLAEMINRDKSTVTALVDKLVVLGYVRRQVSESDSRVNMISVTEKGLQVKQKFFDISATLRARAYKGLSIEEKKTITDLLARILDNF